MLIPALKTKITPSGRFINTGKRVVVWILCTCNGPAAFHDCFGCVESVLGVVQLNSERLNRNRSIACCDFLRFLRFAASTVGDGITGSRGEASTKHDRQRAQCRQNSGSNEFHYFSESERVVDNPQYSSSHTSNDLLFSLDPQYSRRSLNYEVVAQSAEEVQDIQNAPAVSMGPYLIDSGQTRLLTTISIYSQRGENREQVRLLYMNAVALVVWKAMGKLPNLIGEQHRPPKTALLSFGVPFSE